MGHLGASCFFLGCRVGLVFPGPGDYVLHLVRGQWDAAWYQHPQRSGSHLLQKGDSPQPHRDTSNQ